MYKIVITDPWTGRVYNPNGTPYRESSDERYFERPFASLERARKYCRGIVRRYPNLRCAVTDEAGKECWVEMDSVWLDQRKEARLQWKGIHEKELHRSRLILLGSMIGFSLLIAACTAFSLGAGLSLWITFAISCCLAVLVWLVIIVRY